MTTQNLTDANITAQIINDYHKIWQKRLIILTVLLCLTIISFCVDLITGPANISLNQLLDTIFNHNDPNNITISTIFFENRLPVACLALVVGIALSLSGAEMQTILNNPLASPFTLGVSSAAFLGAALTITIGIAIPFIAQNYLIAFNAFIFAFGSIIVLTYLSNSSKNNIERILLFGIALGFTFSAFASLLQYIASAEDLQQLIFWGLGSLSRSSWNGILIILMVILFVLPFSMRACWQMTALRLGEERAQSFGINVKRLRWFSLFRISLLASTAVAFVGTIGFIGLVAPNIARLMVGEDHRFFLPVSALTGALIMSCASIISKVIIPGVIVPVGVVTPFIGLPIFFILIYKHTH